MTNRCPKCKARICNYVHSYDEKHKCPPLWLAQCPEHDDETWDEVYAVTAVFAAESWAEEYDRESLEYDMLDGEMIVVLVKPHKDNEHYNTCKDGGGVIKTFMCSGEAVPTYTAEDIDDKG